MTLQVGSSLLQSSAFLLLKGISLLFFHPKGPGTQESGTWVLGNSNCSIGFG